MFFKQYWNSLGQPNLHSFTGPILYKKLLWIQVSYLQLSVLGSYTVLECWTLHVSSTRHCHIVSSTSMADFCPGPQNVSHIYIMIKAENAIVSKLIYSYACKISPTRVLLRLTIVFPRLLIGVTVEFKLLFSLFTLVCCLLRDNIQKFREQSSKYSWEAILSFFGCVYKLTLKVLTSLGDLWSSLRIFSFAFINSTLLPSIHTNHFTWL